MLLYITAVKVSLMLLNKQKVPCSTTACMLNSHLVHIMYVINVEPSSWNKNRGNYGGGREIITFLLLVKLFDNYM